MTRMSDVCYLLRGNTTFILSYIEIIIVGVLVFGISIAVAFLIKNRRIQLFRSRYKKLPATTTQKLIQELKRDKQVKIDYIAKTWKLTQIDLINFILDQYDLLEGVKIDGDYITIESPDSVEVFIDLIDKEFQKWNDEKKKI